MFLLQSASSAPADALILGFVSWSIPWTSVICREGFCISFASLLSVLWQRMYLWLLNFIGALSFFRLVVSSAWVRHPKTREWLFSVKGFFSLFFYYSPDLQPYPIIALAKNVFMIAELHRRFVFLQAGCKLCMSQDTLILGSDYSPWRVFQPVLLLFTWFTVISNNWYWVIFSNSLSAMNQPIYFPAWGQGIYINVRVLRLYNHP